jgi:hypothetical protein
MWVFRPRKQIVKWLLVGYLCNLLNYIALEVIMVASRAIDLEIKTAELIQKRFHVSDEYARNLAVAALDGIASHGCDQNDWETIKETVKVVVASWIKNGSLKQNNL